ncbi:MAG: DegV family EDD domain-containing protein, partial [Clostridia bacterium]|nr:DegV family EDD domain-containing protein [Clostridia bacterium]
INVFPVADGDTGNNLSATMYSIINESRITSSVKGTLESIADASLGGARGNSGIIFAQYMSGVSAEVENDSMISLENFATAHKNSVRYAYEAINNPVEGTMLTVIREWAHSLFDFHKKARDFSDLLSHSYAVLEESLKKTTNQLRVLKKAGVVDSGAKGFVLFIKGFMDFIKNEKTSAIETEADISHDENAPLPIHVETNFRYCVEAMLDGHGVDREKLKAALEHLGDSLIVAGNEHITRVHIHSNNPAEVFAAASEFSKISRQKVEDMIRQSDIVEHRKHDIALVTDSIADLPKEFLDEHQIHVVPLNIIIDDTEYLDKLTIDNLKVIDQVKNGKTFPTSSQPDSKTVEAVISYLASYYKSIIAITVASELSGTYNVFKGVAEKLSGPGFPITVIDSKQNSGAEGLLVIECAKMIEEGLSHDEIVAGVRELSAKAKILVSVRNLETMIKGGRLGTKAGKFAEKLNMKPIITLDEKGKGTIGGIAFSHKGSKRLLIRRMKAVMKKGGIRIYSIVHVNNFEEAQIYAGMLEDITGIKPDNITEASSIIAISAGDGALALSYIAN